MMAKTRISEWIGATEAANILDTSPYHVRKLAADGRVKTRTWPGGKKMQFLSEDIVRVAIEIGTAEPIQKGTL